jgi:Transaldolase
MKLFIDTGSVAEVEELASWGVLSGATTNPSLLAKEQGDPGDIVRRICELVGGPVSAEVVSDRSEGMVEEGGRSPASTITSSSRCPSPRRGSRPRASSPTPGTGST